MTEGPYRLVLGANRDEFYDRPTAAMGYWADAAQVLAGRDLRGGGTWLGITATGRFGAVTNYRDPASFKAEAPSRGHLVSAFLQGRETPQAYLDSLGPRAGVYNGFNLLLGDRQDLFYFSNRAGGPQALVPGVYGISNHLLNSPWPKVEKGKAGLDALLHGNGPIDPEALFDLLAGRSIPPDGQLPDTGVGLEWERILSPLFIQGPGYGTRSSTVLTWEKNGRINVQERGFDAQANRSPARHFCFSTAGVA
jgi:uncharacterized protein with NRDE domain